MKIQQYHRCCVLQATCSILFLIAATYATSPPPIESRQRHHQQQQQAEVSARPVKFGQKLAQQNEVFLPTPLPEQTLNRSAQGQTGRQGRRQQANGNDISAVPLAPSNSDRQHRRLQEKSVSSATTQLMRRPESQRSRQPSSSINEAFLPTPLSREKHTDYVPLEKITLPTLPPPENSHLSRRRSGGGGSKRNNAVVQQFDIPVVQKSHEKALMSITPAVGQQRQQQQPPSNANRSRFLTANEEHRATDSFPADRQQLTTTATGNNQQQQQQKTHRRQQQSSSTLTARTNSHKNSQHSTLSSSRNANHNAVSSNIGNKSNSLGPSHLNTSDNRKLPFETNLNAPSNSGSGGGRIPPKMVTSTARQQHRSPPASSRSMDTRKSMTDTTTPRPFFSLPNEYNIFSPEFWRFLNPTTRAPHPTTTTTKKPPKKYVPPPQASLKEEKNNYPKVKPTFQPTKTSHVPEYKDNTPNKKDDGPFRIALPTFNILGSRRDSVTESEKDKRDVEEDEDLRSKFNCPRESEVRFQLFPKICKVDDDCRVWNRGEICCEIFGAKSCVSGIPKPLEETSHSPILGVIPRKCPDRPLAELWWEVKECETDLDCWPRVCCPDGRRRYCRTSQPELNTVPVPVKRSFNYLTEYLECTAPPPPIFDLHPKACTSTLDCFPNVCCQEAGLRHCRPPKKSVLTMLANVFNVDLVKRLTQNIVIK